MGMSGYYRWPTVHGERVVFVSEDDLWEVPLGGGAARRLTSGLGEARYPAFSPDGSKIAYVGTEEGATEVFVMDADGGPGRQLTFFGTMTAVIGWSPDGSRIRFRSNHGEFSAREVAMFEVPVEGGLPIKSKLGPLMWYDEQRGGSGRVICRNADDLARWKRYRGGTAGQLWIDRGEGWDRLLPELESGMIRPFWLGERIYFLNDEEGYGNIYSCLPNGQDRKRHTNHVGCYARGPHTDGTNLVYTVGSDLWRFDPKSGESAKIEVAFASPRTQLNRKFVSADRYLDDATLHPKGHSLAVTTRGKLFNFGNWEGAVRQNGASQGVRYRLPRYLEDGETVLVLSDESGEERLEIHAVDGSTAPRTVDHGDLGRVTELALSPDGKHLAIGNHRHEFLTVELESGTTRRVDHGPGLGIGGFDWSPDSRWVVYAVADTMKTSFLRIYDVTEDAIHDVTEPGFKDASPCFDPKGRYLYFVSSRWFEPVYDSLFFEVSFPKSAKPCVLTLRNDLESLFLEKPRPLDGDDDDDSDEDSEATDDDTTDGDVADGDEAGEAVSDDTEPADADKKSSSGGEDDGKKKKKEEIVEVTIDFDGIARRAEPFPVPTGHYYSLGATEERVLWIQWERADDSDDEDESPTGGTLQYFDLDKRRMRTIGQAINGFELNADRSTLLLDCADGLRVVSSSTDGSNSDEWSKPSRKTGWIDLSRIAVSVDPVAEWRQMLRETWRLMRDQYWDPNLNRLDWTEVWERYSVELDRLGSRGEFSDLVWRMQGELGTSHAYEMGGDYRQPPRYAPGHLGVDYAWDAEVRAYRLEHIVDGATWDNHERSPMTAPGVNVKAGEHIVAINGRRLDEKTTPFERLVKHAGREVEVVVRGSDGETRTRTIRAVGSELGARYRDWVSANRRRVHEASDGRLGYIHIPDMSPHGFAEFHRGFLPELRRQGLVVDVRKNGGGHVSQLILEKLARQRIGYDVGRWTEPVPYPDESFPGPLVAVTDEHAGSDGDIFSHCFKLMKLGPLIGKRTWGGVVGIWPRHSLVDNSVTTQPEFAFWFEDVGFDVENWGTQPDIVVEYPPEAAAAGEDPQLDKAIEVALAALAANPPSLPAFGESRTILRPPRELP